MKIYFLISVYIIFWHSIAQSQPITDCAICDQEVLSEAHLKGKTLEELSMLRNEIFARKGYLFSDEILKRYFSGEKWYLPASSNEQIIFNEIENKNLTLIKRLEAIETKKREQALKDLFAFKKALNNNDKKTMARYFADGLTYDHEDAHIYIEELTKAMNYIDLEDIHWNKTLGLYKTSIDNGYSICTYEIEFSYDTVRIKYGMNSHTEIFGTFDDGYSDYMSEAEHQTWWIFKVSEEGIKLDHIMGIG